MLVSELFKKLLRDLPYTPKLKVNHLNSLVTTAYYLI